MELGKQSLSDGAIDRQHEDLTQVESDKVGKRRQIIGRQGLGLLMALTSAIQHTFMNADERKRFREVRVALREKPKPDVSVVDLDPTFTKEVKVNVLPLSPEDDPRKK